MKTFAKLLLVLIIAAIVLLAVSCSPKIIQSTKTVVKDSVVFKTVTVHDTVTIPGAQVKVEHQADCPPAKPFTETQKQGRAELTLSEDAKGKLTAKCECDSLKEVLNRQQTTAEHFHKSTETIHDTKEVYVSHWYDIVARWIAGVVLLLGGLALGWKLKAFGL